jgi:type I restriction enzyme M protein
MNYKKAKTKTPLKVSSLSVADLKKAIGEKLKATPEQQKVVGPLVEYLCSIGWSIDQMIFGKTEWRVPKSPSEQTKREKLQSYAGFPVDIAVFDDVKHVSNPRHLLFMVECKQPDEVAGISQLESYLVGEPHVRLGIWANNPDPSAPCDFVYRKSDGSMLLKRRQIGDFPRPGDAIDPKAQRTSFPDLIPPPEHIFRKTVEDLLDKVVIHDSNVTRREDQLDQLCNLLLLKLESDKQGKANKSVPVFFRTMENADRTGKAIRDRYRSFVALYPETFTTEQDKALRLSNETIALCVEALSGLRLIDLGVSSVSVAFQVLRSEALKQGEGQYFTPQAVIEAGVRLMQVKWEDIVLDPACGTGGFLVETMLDMQRTHASMTPEDLTKWAQTHIFGIEKDAIGLKLTKAIMQIAGDGSAHCVRGDSIRTHNWVRDFPHLLQPAFANGRFTKIITNPPFGQNLKVSATDCRLSGLNISKREGAIYTDLEIGLLFLQRAYEWLRKGGWVGIVLPETYFFSSNYDFVFHWIKPRFRPVIVANVPMDAFQGFCRAKTNFYVFEKLK